MLQKSGLLTPMVTSIVLFGLGAITLIVMFMVVTNQVVGLPVVLLVLLGWGAILLLQVFLPIIAMMQFLVWLNRKLFSTLKRGIANEN